MNNNQNPGKAPECFVPIRLDDTGNGDLFCELYSKLLRYNFTEKVWYYWDGARWAPDPGGVIETSVDDTVKALEEDLAKMIAAEPGGAASRHLKYSRSRKGKDALEKEVRHRLATDASQLDTGTMRFNAKNLTVGLATGKTMAHDPGDMSTRLGGCGISPDGVELRCPTWLNFLNEIFGGDEELIRFVQKACGYSMTGETSEQCLFFLYGAGRNGKSTFLNVLADIFGDYARNIQPQTIMEQRGASSGSANPDVARLKGARFVTTVEPDEGERLNEGLIKQLTGGDTITARYLYGKEFEFKPQFKLWIAANNKPVIRGTDLGIWRRIRLIPFGVTIPEDKVDKRLPEKLQREYPFILRWILEGCMLWRAEGLGSAKQVEQSTGEYRMEMDSVRAFLDECTTAAPEGRVKAAELYAAYRHWCEECGRCPKSSTKFGLEITKTYPKEKTSSGWVYTGVKLNL